ncbi:calcium-binding protein [Myxococcota bacterium]|nr:calcium-binding protein [Myxococcota bacterium]
MKITRTHLHLPALALLPILALACGGTETDEEGLVDESAALALTTEDDGMDDGTSDALAGMGDDEAADAADERIDSTLGSGPTESALVCDFSAMRDAVIARFDANGDGVLDQTERAALRDELGDRRVRRVLRHRLMGHDVRPRYHVFARVRWAFDVDGDGQLSPAERADMITALEARCERRRAAFLERFDANGDGQLSRVELVAAHAALRQAHEARRDALLAEYDVNQDGTLDETERAAVRADVQARRQARRAAIIARFDVNGDGTLDQAERDALKAAIRQRIAEGRADESEEAGS